MLLLLQRHLGMSAVLIAVRDGSLTRLPDEETSSTALATEVESDPRTAAALAAAVSAARRARWHTKATAQAEQLVRALARPRRELRYVISHHLRLAALCACV